MSDFSVFSTQQITPNCTDEYFGENDFQRKFSVESSENNFYYDPIDPVAGVITAFVIFCVGLVLNALILRCYWSVKTSTAVYIRALASIDICVLSFMLFRTYFLHFPTESRLDLISETLGNFVAVVNVLGPLYLALDRGLIVMLPHSFKKHEKNMRIAKIFMGHISVQLYGRRRCS